MFKQPNSPNYGYHQAGPSRTAAQEPQDPPPPSSASSSHNLVLVLIVTPLYLIYHSFIKVVEYSIAGALFQITGEFILYLCGFEGFGLLPLTSLETGAVGGGVIAIPFSAIFSFFIRSITPHPVGQRDEEDPRRPLMSPPPAYGGTANRPVQPEVQSHNILYENQQTQSAAYKTVVGFGLTAAGLTILSPAIGALSGMVGSIALRMKGIDAIGTQNAAKAGGLGGLVWLLFVVLQLFGYQS